MIRKRNVKCILGVWTAVSIMCGLCGCGGKNSAASPENAMVENTAPTTGTGTAGAELIGTETSATTQPAGTGTAGAGQTAKPSASQEVPGDTQSGGELDVVEPSVADDDWYKKGSVYTDENGRKLEVFFDDEGMLGFSVDGLSLYFTSADNYQEENNWKIYTCDDGVVIIYYPGDPAHLEISDGEYAGLYEEDDGM